MHTRTLARAQARTHAHTQIHPMHILTVTDRHINVRYKERSTDRCRHNLLFELNAKKINPDVTRYIQLQIWLTGCYN